jgi:hypothetical protein
MQDFKTGDLVGKVHSKIEDPIQIGIIISHDKKSFHVKWTSYNKIFFMEKTEDIFHDLNKMFLLGIDEFNRFDVHPFLVLLNSNYVHGRQQ